MTVRVGFLGAGNIATYHSKSLRASGADMTWSAVFDTDPDRSKRFAAATGASVAGGPADVVAQSDAIYICTWTSEHEHLVGLAADAGKAVFCEKPLGVDYASAERVVAAVESTGVVNQVGLVLRRSPVFHLLRHVSLHQDAGQLQTVIFRDDQFLPIQGRYASTWRADVDKAGAGVLIEHSIHDIDLLEWMYGPITSVSATARYVHEIAGIEDSVIVSAVFESGLHATLTSVWHDMLERVSNRHVEVFGTKLWARLTGEWFGEVAWNHGAETKTVSGVELLKLASDVSPGAGENPDGAFVEAVANNRPASPPLRTALRAHLVVDACYRSIADGGSLVVVEQ
ncbi:Gfo/Idh/MocA family oxidoreductase [Acidimicrobiaceae bacterium AH-315-P05]|nr:Gfo/Idh/MocA family oxidoreductase [Acidimicrobiaceae bacterium AH-315-P05]